MSKSLKEILEWELSLDSRDLKAHAWYHGNISRLQAEELLLENGDFLVRDCSSTHLGDFVLSCHWQGTLLHFIIHKDVLQPDTIYEQLKYRFESESFDTVADLITYHVGSEIPISGHSGALITSPKNRLIPISSNPMLTNPTTQWSASMNDYASLTRNWSQKLEPALSCKTSTLERSKPTCLNLEPPDPGLIEDLMRVSDKCEVLEKSVPITNSNLDLTNFHSILFPSTGESARLHYSVLEAIVSRLMEPSNRLIAQHITKGDWNFLNAVNENTESLNDKPQSGIMYAKIFSDQQHRWNVADRFVTMSQFVLATVLMSKNPEDILAKWIQVAQELKLSMGNFFSFCAIMKALSMPEFSESSGKINWQTLRSNCTEVTFAYETNLRKAYVEYSTGTADYPPNTTIPNLFSTIAVLEDNKTFLHFAYPNYDDDQLTFFFDHLQLIKCLSEWSSVQEANFGRISSNLEDDIVLQDIFSTELQLCFMYGTDLSNEPLRKRIRDDTNECENA